MAKGDKKTEGLFDGVPEAPKKIYPPIEEKWSADEPEEKFPAAATMDPTKMAEIGSRIEEKAKAIEAAEAKQTTRRKLDPELKAMDEVCEILEPFPPEVQMRILNWAMNKFFPAKTAYKVPSAPFDAEMIKAIAAGRAEFLPPG